VANQEMFTSVHYVDLSFDIPNNKVLLNLNEDYSDYKPLPEIGERLSKGQILAKIKTVASEGFDDVIFEPIKEEVVSEDCVISDIKIYANKWNESFAQFNEYIQKKKDEQKNKRTTIIQKLEQFLTKDELEKFLGTLDIHKTEKTNSNYKVKGETIDGIRVEITAIYERKISLGDKLGNRHGNKGIISIIVPEEKMPVLPDGRKVEVVINPLGVPSRMNIGQLFELHLGMAVTELKRTVKQMFDTDQKDKIYEYVLGFIQLIDKTENHNYTEQMRKMFESVPVDRFVESISNFFVIQPPFESIGPAGLRQALAYTKADYEYKLFDPISQRHFENDIAVGSMYFLKLNHIAEDKISSRGIGPYSVKTAQPLGGKSRKGGQRLGEMEMWAVIAHGCEKNLNEFITVKSDSIRLRNKYISDKMGNSDLLMDSDDDSVSQSLRLLQTNLKSLGLDYYIYDGTQEIHAESEVVQPPVQVIEPVAESAMDLFSHPFGDEKVVYDKSLVEKDDSGEEMIDE
jgi:DNA-directed RNA polymerase beta subunit